MNRNKMYIAIGGLIAIILIGLLIYLMNSQSELSSKQTYTVEIYHCGPLAKDSVALKNEMSVFLLSSAIPASSGFIAPVVDLHEKLEKGDIKKISIPMSGLTGLRETFVSDYYDFNNRKEEENDFIGEHGSFFSSEKYLSFSASALKSGDTAVKSVPYDEKNCITEFFIHTNQPNTNSADNKVWNSLASLKVYINGLIAANRIKAGSVIKVYYQCGVAPPPILDADGDGYEAIKDCDDNDAQINVGAIEICGDSKDNNCDGNIDEGCNRVEPSTTPISEGPGPKSNSPTNFNIIDSQVGWDNGPDELELKVEVYKADGTNPFAKVKIKRGGECIISKDEHDKLSGSLKSVNGKLSGSVFYRSGSSWVFTNLVVDCTKLQYK